MAGDLPAGKYTVALIGAWWPQPSPALRAGAQHWSAQKQLQEQYAQDLHGQWTFLASANQGHTADDLVFRFQQGEKHHLDLAEKYQVKADSFEKGADAIDSLRDGLRGIADDYNQRIANVENSKEPEPMKVAEIQELYLSGKKDEAGAKVPRALIEEMSLVGPKEKIRDDLEKWRESIVTTLLISGDAATLRDAAELVLG